MQKMAGFRWVFFSSITKIDSLRDPAMREDNLVGLIDLTLGVGELMDCKMRDTSQNPLIVTRTPFKYLCFDLLDDYFLCPTDTCSGDEGAEGRLPAG